MGGIIGINTGKSEISACYNQGDIDSGILDPAGIIGDSLGGDDRLVYACYWLDKAGTFTSMVGIVQPGKNSHAKPFGDTSYDPRDPWPKITTHLDWGTGDGSGRGKYWKSLGFWNGPQNSVFPTLFWE